MTLELTLGFILFLMAVAVQIGQAAKLTGLSVDTIRFYQKLGLVKGGQRSANGYRAFGDEQVHDLKFVRRAQALGFSLNEIRELLALRQKHHICPEVRSMLRRKLADVHDRTKSLADLEAELQSALRNCDRQLRTADNSQHDDCCPVLQRLERMNGSEKESHAATTANRTKR